MHPTRGIPTPILPLPCRANAGLVFLHVQGSRHEYAHLSAYKIFKWRAKSDTTLVSQTSWQSLQNRRRKWARELLQCILCRGILWIKHNLNYNLNTKRTIVQDMKLQSVGSALTTQFHVELLICSIGPLLLHVQQNLKALGIHVPGRRLAVIGYYCFQVCSWITVISHGTVACQGFPNSDKETFCD